MAHLLQIIRVVWVDSWYPEDGTYHLMDINTDTPVMEGVGFLVEETPTTILLASAVRQGDHDVVINPVLIPKSAIKEQTKL